MSISPIPTSLHKDQLPNLFSNHFFDKVKHIRDQLDSSALLSPPSPFYCDAAFQGISLACFKPISTDSLQTILKTSPPKFCALDLIPTTLLLDCFDAALHALTIIVNDSLTSGIFPSIFKTAIVKPLLKKPSLDQNELKNYRPVSNLSCLN